MTELTVGIDVGGRRIDLHQLQDELQDAGVTLVHGLTLHGPERQLPPPMGDLTLPEHTRLHTYDEAGAPVELPPEAVPIVEAHVVLEPGSEPANG
jgi:hypothetical protein